MTHVCHLEMAEATAASGRDPRRAALTSEAIKSRIARRRAEEEGADTLFRRRATTKSAGDDEVGGYKARSAPSELGERGN
jgi:hypothetical protein